MTEITSTGSFIHVISAGYYRTDLTKWLQTPSCHNLIDLSDVGMNANIPNLSGYEIFRMLRRVGTTSRSFVMHNLSGNYGIVFITVPLGSDCGTFVRPRHFSHSDPTVGWRVISFQIRDLIDYINVYDSTSDTRYLLHGVDLSAIGSVPTMSKLSFLASNTSPSFNY